jgi:hypothetical protein
MVSAGYLTFMLHVCILSSDFDMMGGLVYMCRTTVSVVICPDISLTQLSLVLAS